MRSNQFSTLSEATYLHEQLKSDARSSLRWRTAVFSWFTITVTPQFKSILQSMNVDLPFSTSALLAATDICHEWPLTMFSLAIGAWWVLERRVFPRLSYSGLRFMARLTAVVFVSVVIALYLPMLKLITNVG